MKKFISFSVFALMVILSLVVKNTVEAQVIVRPRAVVVAPVGVRPVCPGPGFVWVNNAWIYRRPVVRARIVHPVRIRPVPVMRYRRYRW